MEEQIIAAITKELERQGTGSVFISFYEQNAMHYLADFYLRTGQIEREEEIRILLVKRHGGMYKASANFRGMENLDGLASVYQRQGKIEKEEQILLEHIDQGVEFMGSG